MCFSQILKGDGEPSMKQLVSAVTAARSAMKLKTQVEYIPQGHSQSNPAERAIQTVRRLGNTLLEEVRNGAKIQLPSSHVLFSWAYGHAAWLYNRYNVGPNKQTPFEIATDRPYRGRLATFGSAVYGQPLPHKPQQRKGIPAWRKGIFVGKLPDCDLAVMCSNKGLFVSRGIRRCAQEWQPDLLMAIKGQPWEERDTPGPKPGMKALRRERRARQEEVAAEFAEDEEAQAVVLYARERAAAALRSSQRSAAGVGEALPQQLQEEEEVPQGQESQAGMAEQPGQVQVQFEVPDDDISLGMGEELEQPRLVDKRSVEGSEEQQQPKVPRLSELPRGEQGLQQEGQVVGTTSSSTTRLAASPTFAGNITQVNLGENEEVEVDEEFVLHPEDWGDWNNLDFSEMDKSEDDGPPQLGPEELKKLEEEADLCEEQRLCEMGVLIPVEDEEKLDEEYRLMTSRNVYDWRFRDGHWVRRSRLVARDYKFLQPELEGLFSPASNSLGTKVWAALVQSAGGSLSLYSADVKDAYLMVQQEEKVYVTLNDKKYILGRCLPGQRVGSKSWYDLLALVLKQKDLVSYKANPSLFYKKVENEKQRPLIVSTHVDDLQIIGEDGEVQELLQHLRGQGWKLQVDGPCGPHVQGNCSFLKRKFLSDGEGKLWVELNNKYVDKLVEILNLEKSKEKGVPTTGNFQKGLEYKPVTQEESRTFRTCVGILLYMSAERPDIQCATRSLASKVTKPDEGDWRELKQVVLYLKGTRDYAQVMKSTGSMSSALTRIFHPEGDGGEVRADASRGPSLLQVFSDANWAGDRSTRKNTSCAQYFLNGNFFYAATRTQKSIALSSAESEFISAVSAAADGIYLKRMLQEVLGTTIFLELRMDSSAARSLMKRQGVQKTRHIATGLLWVQDKVADGELGVKPVAGQHNPSDLGTKAHSTKRLHYLMSLLGFEKGIGEDESFEESHVQTGNIRRLKRLLPFILATLGPHGANGHDSYGSSEELELKNETCSEPTYVVEDLKKKILELLWYCGVSLGWTAIFVGLCWLRDRLYPRGPRHWSEEAIREDRERRDEEARRTMEYYSSFDYHMFDDDEDYYYGYEEGEEDWSNYQYSEQYWDEQGGEPTDWETRGWYDYTEEEWRQWYEENGWDYPSEVEEDVSNYNVDEPYVNDEYYNIRMVGEGGGAPGEGSGQQTSESGTGPMYQDHEDPTEFLVWMAGRLLTRLGRLTEENDPGRRKFVKYHMQLDILRGVYADFKRGRAPRHRVVWFVNNMADLSEDENDRPGDVPDVCAITALEELSEPGGVFRDSVAASINYEELMDQYPEGDQRIRLLQDEESDFEEESEETRKRRYRNSSMGEVSDPEHWMRMNHFSDSEEEIAIDSPTEGRRAEGGHENEPPTTRRRISDEPEPEDQENYHYLSRRLRTTESEY